MFPIRLLSDARQRAGLAYQSMPSFGFRDGHSNLHADVETFFQRHHRIEGIPTRL